MTLKRQMMIWLKSIAIGSILTLLLTSFIFQNINPIQHLVSVLLIIFGYAIIATLPFQIILYFLVNTEVRQGEKPSRVTMPISIIYWLLIFGILFIIIEGGIFFEIFLVLIISFVPVSLINLYKALSE